MDNVIYSKEELSEAQRQIGLTLSKLRETVKTLKAKEDPERYKSQSTLVQRQKICETLGFVISDIMEIVTPDEEAEELMIRQ